MNWTVQIGTKRQQVSLPDVLVDQQAFTLTIDGRESIAVWHRAAATLSLRDAQGCERLLRLRSRTLERFDGESVWRLGAELQTAAGMRGVTASIEADVPGQETRGGAKVKKDVVVRSQITGKVLRVNVRTGDRVEAGATLVIIEAMKMENRVFVAVGGLVSAVGVKEGDAVATGKELVRIAVGGEA